MGHTGSTRQRLQQAASVVRPTVVHPALAADVEAPETHRITLHGHG
ncbi:hypothetical protein [Streptomyces sp. NPDC059979]